MSTDAIGGGAVPREDWRWFGSAGHLIVGHSCRFHLATEVGPWLVSTVGEYWPERPVREIHAKVHDPQWLAENSHLKGGYFDHAYMKRFGFETVGCGRLYETMVFRIGGRCECGCGLPTPSDWSEVDTQGYNEAPAATEGHYAMCEKYAAFPHDSAVENHP